MNVPGQQRGQLGEWLTPQDLEQRVRCPDCTSEIRWQFLQPGVFRLLILHDNTCPILLTHNRAKGTQP